MKKKMIVMTLTTMMAVSVLTGCSITGGNMSVLRNDNTSAKNQENVAAESQEDTNVVESDNVSADNQENSNVAESNNASADNQENSDITQTDNASANNQEVENSAEANESSSADIFCWQAAIEGVTYTFPCDVSEFEANGWELEDMGTLEENQYVFGYAKNGDKKFLAFVVNLSSEEKNYAQCSIGGISLKSSYFESGLSVVLPGNLTVSKELTQEQIIKTYGEPTEIKESDSTICVEYQMEIYKTFEALFSKKDGSLISIKYQNL